ncbi:ATP-binding cassette domain-containing protein [Rhodoferax sp.]|uniref:ABC transporter ATP-binding protein n=1 Tax=Rhodoferax sp. TaxID=50421 RepID=UPI00271A4EB8|nr:ATP-binding cassette domain-containing protein [Rhodoferax sp.]MDO8321012.1 ATP-binding cassette domain-containing protein [Rhodoferax sp.]
MHNTSRHPNAPQAAVTQANRPKAAPILQLSGVTYCLPERVLFENWSVDIWAGLTLVRGSEGSGKTTLLALLAGAVPPVAGELTLKGVPLSTDHEAYCRQVFRVDPRADTHDAMQVERLFSAVEALYPSFSTADLADLVAGFSLQEHVGKSLYMLSSGTRRKVMLATALVSGAALTLLDEPFAALDWPSVNFLHEVLTDAAQHPSRAFVIADHEAPEGIPLAACIDLPLII